MSNNKMLDVEEFTKAYKSDVHEFDRAGPYWKEAYNNPVVGDYFKITNTLFQVTRFVNVVFSGRYTIELETISESQTPAGVEIPEIIINDV